MSIGHTIPTHTLDLDSMMQINKNSPLCCALFPENTNISLFMCLCFNFVPGPHLFIFSPFVGENVGWKLFCHKHNALSLGGVHKRWWWCTQKRSADKTHHPTNCCNALFCVLICNFGYFGESY